MSYAERHPFTKNGPPHPMSEAIEVSHSCRRWARCRRSFCGKCGRMWSHYRVDKDGWIVEWKCSGCAVPSAHWWPVTDAIADKLAEVSERRKQDVESSESEGPGASALGPTGLSRGTLRRRELALSRLVGWRLVSSRLPGSIGYYVSLHDNGVLHPYRRATTEEVALWRFTVANCKTDWIQMESESRAKTDPCI